MVGSFIYKSTHFDILNQNNNVKFVIKKKDNFSDMVERYIHDATNKSNVLNSCISLETFIKNYKKKTGDDNLSYDIVNNFMHDLSRQHDLFVDKDITIYCLSIHDFYVINNSMLLFVNFNHTTNVLFNDMIKIQQFHPSNGKSFLELGKKDIHIAPELLLTNNIFDDSKKNNRVHSKSKVHINKNACNFSFASLLLSLLDEKSKDKTKALNIYYGTPLYFALNRCIDKKPEFRTFVII